MANSTVPGDDVIAQFRRELSQLIQGTSAPPAQPCEPERDAAGQRRFAVLLRDQGLAGTRRPAGDTGDALPPVSAQAENFLPLAPRSLEETGLV